MNTLITKLVFLMTLISSFVACGVNNPSNNFSASFTNLDKAYSPEVIYGKDDRVDLYDVKNKMLLELADSTAGMVLNRRISPNSDGTYRLKASVYGTSHQLCAEERFFKQRVAVSCSAFLVSANTIVTAGHCVRSQSKCNDISFVFGLSLKNKNKGDNFNSVNKNEIYQCETLIKTAENESGGLGADYAVMTLKRNVTNHSPLKLRRNGSIKKGDPIVIIGHPKGLPTKVAEGAKVTSVQKEFFVSNLDSFSGNSGSAVFNQSSGEVEGILVRGAHDFAFDQKRKCFTSNICKVVNPQTDCRGEDVSKINFVLPHLPLPKNNLFFSSTASLEIPDNNPLGIFSNISVPVIPEDKDFLIHLNISHSWKGDLSVYLESPLREKIKIIKNQGGAGDNIIEIFGQSSVLQKELKSMAVHSPAGTWTLNIKDEFSRDTGKLNSWSIEYR